MLRLFSDVYQKAVQVIRTSQFDAPEWAPIIRGLRILLADDGPNCQRCAALDELRAKVNQIQLKNGDHGNAVGNAIIALCNDTQSGYQDRIALIKFLLHFYMIGKKGGQAVWIADLPQNFFFWPFDMLEFKSEREFPALLSDRKEVFGGRNREMMASAFQLSRKWAADIQVKLAMPNDETLAMVGKWFHLPSTNNASVMRTASVLHKGFKEIHIACNQKQVIFSDRPNHRINPDYDTTIAQISYSDSLVVLYFYKKFLEYGKRGPAARFNDCWKAALTIIHELSHLKAGTEDHRYAYEGIKPGFELNEQESIANADSWAFFAADMVGMLPKEDFHAFF